MSPGRLGDLEVFDLIRKRKLHTALLENLRYLMKLGDEVCVCVVCVVWGSVPFALRRKWPGKD